MEALARRPPQPLPSRRAAGWRRPSPQRSTHEPRRPSLATRRDARTWRCPCQSRDARRRRSTATASSREIFDTLQAVPSSSRGDLRRCRCVAAIGGNRRCRALASSATRDALASKHRQELSPSDLMCSSSANATRSLHHVVDHAAGCPSLPARHHNKTHSNFSDRLACAPTLPSPWSKEIPTRCCEVWCRFHFRTRMHAVP